MSTILRENEKIIKVVRQDMVFLVPALLFLALITIGAAFFHWKVTLAVGVVSGLIFIGKIIFWRRTVLMVTNERLVCHVQKGIFSSFVIEILIADAQEISYEKDGIFASLFQYGNLLLRTASDSTHVFERIPHPERIVEALHTLRV